VISWFQNLLSKLAFEISLYRYIPMTTKAATTRTDASGRTRRAGRASEPMPSNGSSRSPRRVGRASVGLYTLTPPDPQLKGAWYPGGFNPCDYQVKKLVSKFAFQMQLVPLRIGATKPQQQAAAVAGQGEKKPYGPLHPLDPNYVDDTAAIAAAEAAIADGRGEDGEDDEDDEATRENMRIAMEAARWGCCTRYESR
jgi:hypothetical protein